MSKLPTLRIRAANRGTVNAEGEYILYWMNAFRRPTWNFSLQRAVEWAQDLDKPLVVFEALRCGYRWANDRLHGFVIQGMLDNAQHFARKDVLYFPYLEANHGEGKGLLAALAEKSCIVVSDDFPCFFLPKMVASASRQIPVRFELIDSNGILPMRSTDRVFARAHDFRRFLQKTLRPHLAEFPQAAPLKNVRLAKLKRLPAGVTGRWPAANLEAFLQQPGHLSQFPIDHAVNVATQMPGGWIAAEKQLQTFIKSRLLRYVDDRNQPEAEVTSGLSPYLHFGHISSHQIFTELMGHDEWTPSRLAEKATGSSSGWWGANATVESFLDELITWREVGFNMCWQREDFDQYESLPEWAQKTLQEHANDPREFVYSFEQFDAADTHDPLWNAAQHQLVREGRIHNYLRMVWGKKILEWSPTPQQALNVLIELNNKYALDGRDPNSYSGIFWCLGRYDRAWGPERPIFGKIRYMSSENTARKVRVKNFIATYSETS